MLSEEINLTVRDIALDLDMSLADQMLAPFETRQKPLGKVHEPVRASGVQAAIDEGVVMKGAALHLRKQAVLPAHVVANGVIDVAPRRKITYLGFDVQLFHFFQNA